MSNSVITFSPRHFEVIGSIDLKDNNLDGLFNDSGLAKLKAFSVASEFDENDHMMQSCLNSKIRMNVKMSWASARFYGAKFENKDITPGILSYVTWFLLYLITLGGFLPCTSKTVEIKRVWNQ